MIERMQALLEAERAGVACLSVMAEKAASGEMKEFLVKLRNDEGRFCAGLYQLIRSRGATPRQSVGPFADKVLMLKEESERLTLLNKGQAWVVRKIDEIPPSEMTPGEKTFFAEMREAHVANIEACTKFLPAS
jgi:nitronate monooxygenase